MKTFNKDHPHTEVGGRAPLFYMQDGRGYSRSGEYLGDVNDQGEFAAKKTATAGYESSKVPELKELIEARNLQIPEDAKKADLVALLEADDAVKSQGSAPNE